MPPGFAQPARQGSTRSICGGGGGWGLHKRCIAYTAARRHAPSQRLGLDSELPRLSVIHVAGTKGKGSTCAMVERILRESGYRTGLYTSPHLVDVRERIRINGCALRASTLAALRLALGGHRRRLGLSAGNLWIAPPSCVTCGGV